MNQKRMPSSFRKYIRKEKSRIRREVLDLKKQEELIKGLYLKFEPEKVEKKIEEKKVIKKVLKKVAKKEKPKKQEKPKKKAKKIEKKDENK
jgi:predicted small secreted protein